MRVSVGTMQNLSVSGQTTYLPTAIPISGNFSGNAAYKYHWYAGSVYKGASKTAQQVSTVIQVPSGSPSKTQFYYVLLSVWDNTGSYDQIGFSDDNGVWGLTYSTTTGSCANPTYHFDADAKPLSAGATYQFSMIPSGGKGVVFFVLSGDGKTIIFDHLVKNGASDFSIANTYCKYYDYTDYEEVYSNTANSVPGSSFVFNVNAYINSGSYSYPVWAKFLTNEKPAVVTVFLSGSNVKIKN